LSRFFFSVVQFTFGWSSVEYFSIAWTGEIHIW
jgi:hypothetical protein